MASQSRLQSTKPQQNGLTRHENELIYSQIAANSIRIRNLEKYLKSCKTRFSHNVYSVIADVLAQEKLCEYATNAYRVTAKLSIQSFYEAVSDYESLSESLLVMQRRLVAEQRLARQLNRRLAEFCYE